MEQKRSLLGYFILVKVGFAEMDGRYKTRPCLVIAERKLGNEMVYLVAPKYSSLDKCRGENEVVMSIHDAVAVGIDREGVVRFNREHQHALKEDEVIKAFKHFSALPPLKQQALKNAAKRVNCMI